MLKLTVRIVVRLCVAAAAGVILVWVLGLGAASLRLEQVGAGDGAGERRPESAPEVSAVGLHRVGEWLPTETAPGFSQAPELELRVAEGTLPPASKRLPEDPLVVYPPEQNGPYGGTWTQFATGPQDLGDMYLGIGYEPLVRWDPALEGILPNLAVDWEVLDEGREFVFRLRRGVRWSDGQPYTAADILFWYEHVLKNPELTPAPHRVFLHRGEVMELEQLDDYTLRFRFSEPHGLFLQWLAVPFISGMAHYPKHYLKRFHPDFADFRELERKIRRSGFSFWHQLFQDKAEWRNPELPTIRAWKLEQPPPASPVVFRRNPYYWKVDGDGRQLPYIDLLAFRIFGNQELVTLNLIGGRMGMQHRHIQARDYPLIMGNRESGGYRVKEWKAAFGSGVLMPNLNHRDPVMREIIGDRRFRLALSHAIDRYEINEAVYYGLGTPMQMAPLPHTELFDPEYAFAHTEYDPEKAERLLDAMGLERKGPSGNRLRPDGRPLQLVIETFGLLAEQRTLELVADHWSRLGVETRVRQLASSLFYTRMPARLHDVAVGGNSNYPIPLLDQMYLIPGGPAARHGIGYAAWFQSGGTRGERPPEAMRRAMELYREIEVTVDPEGRRSLAREILDINRENLWLIGLVGAVPQPVLVRKDFRNVPDSAGTYGSAGLTAPECYAIDGLVPDRAEGPNGTAAGRREP